MLEANNPKKTKKKIIVILLIIIIVLILILIIFFLKLNKENPCENIKDKTQREKCERDLAFERAIEKGDIAFCDTLENSEDCKDKMYLNIAVINNNRNLCNEINGEEKETCFFSLALINALREDNVDLCKGLNSEIEKCRDEFFYEKSKQENNLELCGEIVNEILKNSCLGKLPPEGIEPPPTLKKMSL